MRQYESFHSVYLGQEMEHLIFGSGGAPVLVFPSSKGPFYQWEDFKMIESLAEPLEKGWLQLFCVDSVDHLSWYNFDIHQRDQLEWHLAYEEYLLCELLPYIRSQHNDNPFLIATGASFGGFHAMNFGLRYPEVVKRVVAMSGDYEAQKYVDGYFDEDVLFNSPLDYLRSRSLESLNPSTRETEYILTSGKWDFCMQPTLDIAHELSRLEIPHQIHIWDDPGDHDWPLWRQQARCYL